MGDSEEEEEDSSWSEVNHPDAKEGDAADKKSPKARRRRTARK